MKFEPTKISTLLLIAIFMTSFGWSITRLWPTWFDQDLQVPLLVPATIFLLLSALTVWTVMVRARLNPDNKEVSLDPIMAARTVALSMSASRVGSLAGGLYLGIFLVNFFQRDLGIVGQRLFACGLAVIASVLLIVVALWLERMCKIKQPPTKPETSGLPA